MMKQRYVRWLHTYGYSAVDVSAGRADIRLQLEFRSQAPTGERRDLIHQIILEYSHFVLVNDLDSGAVSSLKLLQEHLSLLQRNAVSKYMEISVFDLGPK